MASDEDKGEKTITQVPERLLYFVRSRIASYLSEAKNFSAEIHQTVGQAARLIVTAKNTEPYLKDAQPEDGDQSIVIAHADQTPCTAIIIGNIPPTIDEEVLEILLESKKKGAGARVKSLRLNRRKNWAVVEFFEPDAVDIVMSKVPLSLMGFELKVHPYAPIVSNGYVLDSLEICNLPEELTEELLAKEIDATLGSAEDSSAEFGLEDVEVVKNNDAYEGYIEDIIPVKLRMLLVIEYPESVAERFPSVNLKINLEDNRIYIGGKTADMMSAKLDLYQTLSAICVYKCDCIAPELYQSSRVTEYINKTLTASKLKCAWVVQNRQLCICSLEEDIARCCDLVKKSLKQVVFPICNESATAFLSSKWQDMLKELRKEREVLCKTVPDGSGTEVQVISTSNAINLVVERIKAFLNQGLRIGTDCYRAENLGSRFAELDKNDNSLGVKILDKISSNLSLHHVTIDYHRRSNYSITGTNEGRLLAEKRIQKLEF